MLWTYVRTDSCFQVLTISKERMLSQLTTWRRSGESWLPVEKEFALRILLWLFSTMWNQMRHFLLSVSFFLLSKDFNWLLKWLKLNSSICVYAQICLMYTCLYTHIYMHVHIRALNFYILQIKKQVYQLLNKAIFILA